MLAAAAAEAAEDWGEMRCENRNEEKSCGGGG